MNQILAETKPNGGTSLRDAVNRVAADVAAHRTDVAQLRSRMEQFERNRVEREG